MNIAAAGGGMASEALINVVERRGDEAQPTGPNTSDRNHTRRVRAVRVVALLLTACAPVLLAACGAAQTQNRGAGAVATPTQQAAAPPATPAQESVREGDVTIT